MKVLPSEFEPQVRVAQPQAATATVQPVRKPRLRLMPVVPDFRLFHAL